MKLGNQKDRIIKLARKMKNRGWRADLSHCQKLNLIVKKIGFKSWNHYCAK